MSKGLKIFLIIILVLSALVDALWLTIYFVAPDKVSMKTFNVSGLTGTQDSDGEKIPIIEVNVFDNCLETKFNYFCNTDSSDVYSTGVQQLFNSKDEVINGNYYGVEKVKYNGGFLGLGLTQSDVYARDTLSGKVYYYNSDKDLSFKATNNLREKSGFYISVGEDRYLMTFKNEYFLYAYRDNSLSANTKYFLLKDINYFLVKLYGSVMNMSNFTSGRITFEFGDLFDYYKETSAGVFEKDPVSEQENEKILRQMVSYYNIKVNVHKGNIERAEQSLFKQVGFNANYYTGEIETTNYYAGKLCYVLTEKDFKYGYDGNCRYSLIVKESALDYVKLLGEVNVIIKIDLDYLQSKIADCQSVVVLKETNDLLKPIQVVALRNGVVDEGGVCFEI